jgi:hypothetical protein
MLKEKRQRILSIEKTDTRRNTNVGENFPIQSVTMTKEPKK